jgi:serine/threonine protein kinase
MVDEPRETVGSDSGDPGPTIADTSGDGGRTSHRIVPGDSVGPFKILSVIGEGGFGIVFLAEQTEPVKRRVALKVIKAGMDTDMVVARFEAERQAVAMMNHPGIAKVFEAGATKHGRPYFVMEYVKGEPLSKYCDKHKLITSERLDLFAKVCDAIQHAHQKGVIHRDLKPGNILVSVNNRDEPQPKVIDFGIAKATSQQLTEKTIFTQQGEMIGTPEYMSPEQAEMTGADIDTRSDVYSLGVILYELLSGKLPFDPQTLRSKGYSEIQRIIREEDPPRPSTRLTAVNSDATVEIARDRQTTIDSLSNALRRELEWIPLKALRKDRTDATPPRRRLPRMSVGIFEAMRSKPDPRPRATGCASSSAETRRPSLRPCSSRWHWSSGWSVRPFLPSKPLASGTRRGLHDCRPSNGSTDCVP